MIRPRDAADAPLTETERAGLRLIVGGAPDTVARARSWCEENNAQINFTDGRFVCRRGAHVLDTARYLDVLLARLEGGTP